VRRCSSSTAARSSRSRPRARPRAEGTTVELKDEAAKLLNDTFGTDALGGGLVIGVAKITVNTA